MNKKDIIIQAEKFLNKNLLYGTISGIRVKDYLENNADKIVKDGWSVEEAAVKIEDSMYSRETSEPLFIYASSIPELPINANNKYEYINSFINHIPFKDTIRIGPNPNDIINIEEELNNIINNMNDDYTINVGDNKVSIKDYYNMLLNQEFIPPTRLDKLDVIMAAVREFRSKTPNFDELSEKVINGKKFIDILAKLPERMNDNMDVLDGMSYISIGDYLVNEFNKVSEYFYNSVDSKPTNVETISLSMGKNNKLEATNEYIFMSEEEEKSIEDSISQKNNESDYNRLYDDMLIIIDGINKSTNVDTLSLFEDRITDVRNRIRTNYSNDSFINNLYVRILNDYSFKQETISETEKNMDDMEVVLTNRFNDIIELIKDLKIDYHHAYQDVSTKIEGIKSLYYNLKRDIEHYGIKMHYDLDKVDDMLREVEVEVQYSMDSVNHYAISNNNDLEDLISRAYSAYRSIEYAQTPVERTACEIKAEGLKTELTKQLDSLLERGMIDEVAHHNYLTDLNKKITKIEEQSVRRVA